MLQYFVVSRNQTTEECLYLCLYINIILWFMFYKLCSLHVYTFKKIVMMQITLGLNCDIDDTPQITTNGTCTIVGKL